MTINLPDDVRFIIKTLLNAGYEAYAVGGCVRDSILKREPQDWDITTSAMPETVKLLFNRTIDTGIRHGTVTIMRAKTGYEVTTYRIDGDYKDNRHPSSVSFTGNLREDLKRRDFTINAMAYNDSEGIVDMFNGINDLNHGIIRCVGNPSERFNEDALRILRAVRFSAQLNFSIEKNTFKAALEDVENLKKISAERIRTELNKLLLSQNPSAIETAYMLGITRIVLPEYDHFHSLNNTIDNITLFTSVLNTISASPHTLRWAALLYLIGSGITPLRRFKFDNYTINTVARLLSTADIPLVNLSDAELRKTINIIGSDIMNLVFNFHEGIFPEIDLYSTKKRYVTMLNNNVCTSIDGLAVNGGMLKAAGIPQGAVIGYILKKLLEKVLDCPELNNTDSLLAMALDIYKEI